MTLNPKKSPALYSAVWGCGLLLLLSFLPVWTSVSAWKGHPSLWTILRAVRYESRNAEPVDLLRKHHETFIRVFVIVAIGVVLGRLDYWLRWEQRRTDEKKTVEKK